MNNGVIICEGSTDYVLLQYYMRKAYGWMDDKARQTGIIRLERNPSRKFFRDEDTLTIMSTGGCSRLLEGMKLALLRNYNTVPNGGESFYSIVMITDRDEIDTENDFLKSISDICAEKGVVIVDNLAGNVWCRGVQKTQVGLDLQVRLLILVIPFEENGALETFLLNAISEKDIYDKGIIDKCKLFVGDADPEERYLNHRRLKTKAIFDSYFSIRTPYDQFVQRGDILKSVKWEEYEKIQRDFRLLGEL